MNASKKVKCSLSTAVLNLAQNNTALKDLQIFFPQTTAFVIFLMLKCFIIMSLLLADV